MVMWHTLAVTAQQVGGLGDSKKKNVVAFWEKKIYKYCDFTRMCLENEEVKTELNWTNRICDSHRTQCKLSNHQVVMVQQRSTREFPPTVVSLKHSN